MNNYRLFLISFLTILNGCTTTREVATNPLALKELTPKNAKEYFCNGEKAKRSLTQRIITRTPSFAGLDLETAQKDKAELVEQFRTEAKILFPFNITPIQKDRFSPKFTAHMVQSKLKSSDYDQKLKTLKYKRTESYIVLVSFEDRPELYAVPSNAWLEMERSWHDQYGKELETQYRHQYEAEVLSNNFILLAPRFKTKKVPSFKDAVEDRTEAWQEYLLISSSVKEAPEKDSEELSFEVSLDLNGFCKYGHDKDQLIVK